MALQFAVSNSALKPGLYAGQPPPRPPNSGEWPRRRHVAASLVFHLLILFGIFLLPRTIEPLEVPVPLVTLVLDESGAAGSAGGRAGGGGGGSGTEATSAAPPQQAAQPQTTEQMTAEAETEPSGPAKPEPAPPTPTPPEASPLPPAPQGLAPPPKPRPRPVVRPRPPAAKPMPPVAVKPAETKPVERPTPLLPPQVATQPPPGPSNGQGAAAQNPQPGTAATGTANAGPGGATGVGTGAAGAGRGALGNGKGTGDDYLDRLRRHIAKYKRYPPDALKGKQEGTVWVTIEIARDGTVLDAQIQRSSGYPLLDRAILDMVHAASPVPPLPAEVTGETRRIGLPWEFRVGFFDRVFN